MDDSTGKTGCVMKIPCSDIKTTEFYILAAQCLVGSGSSATLMLGSE